MDSYYLTVGVIAIVILISILTYLGIKMSSMSSEVPWPPATGDCPDYWNFDTSGNNCVASTKNIGSLSKGYSFSPTTISYNGMTSNCSLKKWANENSVIWDGISNYNQCA